MALWERLKYLPVQFTEEALAPYPAIIGLVLEPAGYLNGSTTAGYLFFKDPARPDLAPKRLDLGPGQFFNFSVG
jgi:hypothetical protein